MRSKLFVPGSRPELFVKALGGLADGLSFDLEDSVHESRKAEAREAIGGFLASPGLAASLKVVIVRVNGLRTAHFEADVRSVACARLDLLNLPKVESAEDILAAAEILGRIEAERGLKRQIGILANIETARGLGNAAAVASAAPRVAGLQLGLGDLFGTLGVDRSDTAAIHHVQMAMRLAAGEAGIWAFDAAFPSLADPAGFEREAQAARRLGFLGKSCIHPSQVATANKVFRPSDEEIAHSLRVVEAAKTAELQGVGAFTVDGRMIDLPFVLRAQAIVAIARQLDPEKS